MQKRSEFKPIHKILIPFIRNGAGENALNMARQFNAEIILVGVVVIPDEQSLSVGAESARALRRTLRALDKDERIVSRARVIVSHQPWNELYALAQRIKPDLLCMEFDGHLSALKISASDALTRPPCDIALVRGKISEKPKHVLTTVRGGPHAELAVRVGLGLRPSQMTSLHIRKTGESETDAEPSFKALNQALRQIPEVEKKIEITDLAAEAILKNAQHADAVIMGATNDPVTSSSSLGYVADRVLREAPCAVIAVKSGRPAPQHFDEASGYNAISILVDKWFAENTFHADEFGALREMVELKKQRGLTVSLALPALNEEATVQKVIRTMKSTLMRRFPLIDEIVLIDSNSTDRTREIAAKEGVPVYIHQELLPRMGARSGKGEALWKSLLVTQGDIVAWIDTDIVNIHPRFVYGIIGPLLSNPNIQFVKGFYRRPLRVGAKMQAGGGGRVTELTARPLLNLFYPELSGVVQPLSGEYAGRRTALERSTFYSGYGVETGLLIDIYENFGLDAIAQVDLLERVHHNQPLEALSKMSFAIIQTVIRKLEKRFGRAVLEDVNRSMKLIRHNAKGYFLDVEHIPEYERPPMIEMPEYARRNSSP
ncbi:MAG: glucosyl-3-phosphoglycerate synthase [Anaerolineales bacterium]|nr:glucosyl-3-phosphoglycerate synthase [Anaerolineales bacterium]